QGCRSAGAGRDGRSIDPRWAVVNGNESLVRSRRYHRSMDRLSGRVILITGSTGIAAATALRCAAEGASVFVVSRSGEHAQALAERIATDRAPADWAAADLSDGDDADAAVAAAVERF